MLIETTAGELKLALDAVKPAIYRRNTIPILGNVLFRDGAATATNLDLEITVKFSVNRFDGSCTVPHRQLSELVKSLPFDLPIRLQDGGDHGLLVFFKGGRYKLPTLPPADFPIWPDSDSAMDVATPDGLLVALAACEPFISTEETRYYLNGVCFSRGADGEGLLVATDGHRLIAYEYAHDIEADLILPRMALPALFAQGQPEAILAGEKHMQFLIPGGGRVRSKLIDGDYPDWRRVVPEASPDTMRLTFNPLEMGTVLNRIEKLIGRKNGSGVTISANAAGDVLVVTAAGMDMEECAERLETGSATGWPGASERRCFNSRYLREICRLHCQADQISIIAADGSSPARIVPEKTRALSVLMPMRADSALTLPALMAFANPANDTVAAGKVA